MLKVSLRDVRRSRGYSVKEIANHCYLTEDCYMEYENDFGKTPARIAFAICSLLKVSLDSIYMSE